MNQRLHRVQTYLNRFFNAMGRTRIVVGVDFGEEHGINQRRLAQSRFADDHQCKLEAFLDGATVHLIGQICETHVIDLSRFIDGRWYRRRSFIRQTIT